MFYSEEFAENTIRAYRSDLRAFETWAIEQGLETKLNTKILLKFIDANRKRWKPATLSRRVFALSTIAQKQGHNSLVNNEILALLGVISRNSMPQRKAKPLMMEDLLKIVEKIPKTLNGIRDKTLLLVGWWGALRRSEIVALKCDDCKIDKNGLILNIKKSKTSKNMKQIALPRQMMAICPVNNLIIWMTRAGIRNEGYLFTGFRGKEKTKKQLTGGTVGKILKKRAKEAGINIELSAHSLRAGFITEAALAGVTIWAIMQTTRHTSPRTVEGYIRTPGPWQHNPADGLSDKLQKEKI